MAEPIEILPVTGIGSIEPGDDLAAIIAGAAPWLRDGDVVVVTSKIVSKSEGRLVEVPAEEGPEREAAREARPEEELPAIELLELVGEEEREEPRGARRHRQEHELELVGMERLPGHDVLRDDDPGEDPLQHRRPGVEPVGVAGDAGSLGGGHCLGARGRWGARHSIGPSNRGRSRRRARSR